MLRVIETTGTLEIVKSSNNKTGQTNFYGVREKGAKNRPFDATFPTLTDARMEVGIVYRPPVIETPNKAFYQKEPCKNNNKRK